MTARGLVPAGRAWAWIGTAVVLVTVVAGARGDSREPGVAARHDPGQHHLVRPPRFLLTAGSSGSLGDREGPRPAVWPPWLQIHALDPHGLERLVDSVPPPSPSAGVIRELLQGPDGGYVAVSAQARPCRSQVFRFRLTAGGQATGITPIPQATTPSLLAGLAVSPDGRRIAFTTAPCADVPARQSMSPDARAWQPAPLSGLSTGTTLTVLDLPAGRLRTWTATGGVFLGEIVWAGDGHTVGYTTARVNTAAAPSTSPAPYSRPQSARVTVTDVTVRALDTDRPGTDLLSGRVLFRPPGDAGVVTAAVMNPDGRSGYGMLHKGQPPSTILFTFTEARPMRVTTTIPPARNDMLSAVAISSGDGPRYACLNGLDSFGRVIDGVVTGGDFDTCHAANGY